MGRGSRTTASYSANTTAADYYCLNCTATCRHASPSEVYVLVAVDERGEDVMSDDLSSTQRAKSWRGGSGVMRSGHRLGGGVGG